MRNGNRDEITSEKVNTQKRDNGEGESKERRSKKLERRKKNADKEEVKQIRRKCKEQGNEKEMGD